MRRLEYLFLWLRDKLGIPFKPERELEKIGIKRGQIILDYGCGIGSYTIPAAKLVGENGVVYALDKEPLAIKIVEKKAEKEGLRNIQPILSDKDTRLPDESVDTIFLFGVLPELGDEREAILNELYRILRPDGFLVTRYCFRMGKEEVVEKIESTNLYTLMDERSNILIFRKR